DKESKDYQNTKVNKFNDEENSKEKDEIAKGNKNYKKQRISPHYFMMMKQLTLLGYFTSKEGLTKAVNYQAVPGRFEGCIPYKKGDKLMV
ncbi:MAG: gluconate 2-dehydrogenase subunit 3 family protein, partial [Flavisolibacter sp.]